MNLGNRCFLSKYTKGKITQIDGKIATVKSKGVEMKIPLENPQAYKVNQSVMVQNGKPLDKPLLQEKKPIEQEDVILFRTFKGNTFTNIRNEKPVKQDFNWDAVDYIYVATEESGNVVGAIQLANTVNGVIDPATGQELKSEFIPPIIDSTGENPEFKKPMLKSIAKSPWLVSTNILQNTKPLTEDYEKGYNDILIDWGHLLLKNDGYKVNVPEIITEAEARSIENTIYVDAQTNYVYAINETLVEGEVFQDKSSYTRKAVQLQTIDVDDDGNEHIYNRETGYYTDRFNFGDGIIPNKKFSGKVGSNGYLAGVVNGGKDSVAAVYYPCTLREHREMSGDSQDFQPIIDSFPIVTVYEVDSKQFSEFDKAESYCEENEIPVDSIESREISSAIIDVETGYYVEDITDHFIQVLKADIGTVQLYNLKLGLNPILDYTSTVPVIINYNQFVYKDSLYDLGKLSLDDYTGETKSLPSVPDKTSFFFGFGEGKNLWSSSNFATENTVKNNGLKIKTMQDYSLEDFMTAKNNEYRKLLDLEIPDVYEINRRMEEDEQPFELESDQNLDEKLDYLDFASLVKSSTSLRAAFSSEGGKFGEYINSTYIPYTKENRRDYTLYDNKDSMREFYYTPETYPEDELEQTEEKPKVRNVKCLKIDGNEEDIYTFMLDKRPVELVEGEEAFDNTPLSFRLFIKDQTHRVAYETSDGVVVTELERYESIKNEEIKFPRISEEVSESKTVLKISDEPFYYVDGKTFPTRHSVESYCTTNNINFSEIQIVTAELHDIKIAKEPYSKEYFTEGVDYTVDYSTGEITFIDSGNENWSIGYYDIILFNGKIEEDTFEDEVIPIFLVAGKEFENFEDAKTYCENNGISILQIISALKVWIFNKYYVDYTYIPNLTDEQIKAKSDKSIKLDCREYDFFVRYGSKYFAYLLGSSDKNPAEGEEGHIPEYGYKLQKYDLATDILSDAEVFENFLILKIGDLEINIDPFEETNDKLPEWVINSLRLYQAYNRVEISEGVYEWVFENLNFEKLLKEKFFVGSKIVDKELVDYYYVISELNPEYGEDLKDRFLIYNITTDTETIVEGHPVVYKYEDKIAVFQSKWLNSTDTLQPDTDIELTNKAYILTDSVTEIDITTETENFAYTGYELFKKSIWNRYDYNSHLDTIVVDNDNELLSQLKAIYGEESDNPVQEVIDLEENRDFIYATDTKLEKAKELDIIYYTVNGNIFGNLELAQEYCSQYDIDESEIIESTEEVNLTGFSKDRLVSDSGKILQPLEEVELIEDIEIVDESSYSNCLESYDSVRPQEYGFGEGFYKGHTELLWILKNGVFVPPLEQVNVNDIEYWYDYWGSDVIYYPSQETPTHLILPNGNDEIIVKDIRKKSDSVKQIDIFFDVEGVQESPSFAKIFGDSVYYYRAEGCFSGPLAGEDTFYEAISSNELNNFYEVYYNKDYSEYNENATIAILGAPYINFNMLPTAMSRSMNVYFNGLTLVFDGGNINGRGAYNRATIHIEDGNNKVIDYDDPPWTFSIMGTGDNPIVPAGYDIAWRNGRYVPGWGSFMSPRYKISVHNVTGAYGENTYCDGIVLNEDTGEVMPYDPFIEHGRSFKDFGGVNIDGNSIPYYSNIHVLGGSYIAFAGIRSSALDIYSVFDAAMLFRAAKKVEDDVLNWLDNPFDCNEIKKFSFNTMESIDMIISHNFSIDMALFNGNYYYKLYGIRANDNPEYIPERVENIEKLAHDLDVDEWEYIGVLGNFAFSVRLGDNHILDYKSTNALLSAAGNIVCANCIVKIDNYSLQEELVEELQLYKMNNIFDFIISHVFITKDDSILIVWESSSMIKIWLNGSLHEISNVYGYAVIDDYVCMYNFSDDIKYKIFDCTSHEIHLITIEGSGSVVAPYVLSDEEFIYFVYPKANYGAVSVKKSDFSYKFITQENASTYSITGTIGGYKGKIVAKEGIITLSDDGNGSFKAFTEETDYSDILVQYGGRFFT